jgi:3-oxoacyl-[acyl-carrier-protein] synthase III
MAIQIASSSYALPSKILKLDDVLRSEKSRTDAALSRISNNLQNGILENLGVDQVRVCGQEQPYQLALDAASQAVNEAGINASEIDLIIDFVTLPGDNSPYVSFAHKLSSELGAEDSINLSFRLGGCAGLHLAIKSAMALMNEDDDLRMALLVTADSPPQGSRTLLPIAVQGDAGSAVVLVKNGKKGPALLASEVRTLSHLHDTIVVRGNSSQQENLYLHVDSDRIENEVMPIYYLNFFHLISRALAKTGLTLNDIDHFIYSNISRIDYCSFVKALHLPESKMAPPRFADLGHTFASDLVINYTDLRRKGGIAPGQHLLFASAGIGFTWGVTIARA